MCFPKIKAFFVFCFFLKKKITFGNVAYDARRPMDFVPDVPDPAKQVPRVVCVIRIVQFRQNYMAASPLGFHVFLQQMTAVEYLFMDPVKMVTWIKQQMVLLTQDLM
jgi:hypothetical protein